MEEPPELFTNPSCRGFLVQATAAGARQRGWMKERLASAWVMSPWTRDEIGALQSVIAFHHPYYSDALNLSLPPGDCTN